MAIQCTLVAAKTGVLQLVARGGGSHVVGAVAIGAVEAGLAMHAAGICVEDGIVTFAARGAACCVIRGFGHHRMRTVTVSADGSVRVTLTEESSMNAALVQLEYRGVTGLADPVHLERIFTTAGDLPLDRGMVLERSGGMTDGAPDLVMHRFRKHSTLHLQGEHVSVRQFHLEALGGMAGETLPVQLGKSAVGGVGTQARNSDQYHRRCQPSGHDQTRVELRSGHSELAPADRHFGPHSMRHGQFAPISTANIYKEYRFIRCH